MGVEFVPNGKLQKPYRDEKDVLDALHTHTEIKFVRFIFPDILGMEASFCVPAREMERAFEEGKGFDGSSVEGLVRIEESDVRLMPDPGTFRVLPWKYKGATTGLEWREAVIFGDILNSDGSPNEGDTRNVLRRTLCYGKGEFGFDKLYAGPELEHFLVKSSKKPELLDNGGYFIGGRFGEVRKEVQLLLAEMGIESEYDHHEVARSQHEIDLRYTDALAMADIVMIFKYMVKKVAERHGIYATFMPKPVAGINGSGMHVHQSVWKEEGGKERNLFFDSSDEYHLSGIAKKYIAGLLKYGGEISAVVSQHVNSYKRLVPGFEAPTYICWGQRNRSAFVRVPEYVRGKENALRAELRSPDPACNIYLAFAVMYAAGLRGIEENLELPKPVNIDIYHMSEEEREKLDIKTLPGSLKEAVELMERSSLVRGVLGEHIFQKFIENKKLEVKNNEQKPGGEYDTKVSPYEIKRYLPVL